MVVLAAAVLTKTGRALLSRQFVDLTRVRIEGLLSAFPKLLNPDSQHTFIETANVRYLYQPIDALYVVIITTKQSNILEDLETLHLFAKVIPDTCRVSTEEEVCNKAFDLVFAFDEVVSLGYKENVTLPQIRTFIEMDSHEERIHDLVEKNKMKDVKAAAKRKQKEIRATQKSSMQGFGGGGRSSGGGMASRSMGSGNSMSSKSAPAAEPYVVDTKRKAKQSETRRTGGGGMKLGKGGAKKNDFLEHLVEEGDIEVDEYRAAVAPSSADASASAAALPDVKHEAVHVSVEEKLTAVISNDGGLQSFDVVGEFKLTVREPAFDKVKIQLTQSDQNMQFKTHPNVNKQAFTNESRIETKRPDRGYPVGTSLGVVKWRVASKDESLLPLSVSCWPSPGADNTIVNVEYELLDDTRELRNVLVTVPLPGGHVPVVAQVDGTHTFDHKAQCMQWTLPLIDQDSSTGSLEFTLPVVVDSAALFPIHVAFVTEQTFTTLQIESMTAPDVDEVKYSEQRALTVNYTVEN